MVTVAFVSRDLVASDVQLTLTTVGQLPVITMEPVLTKLVVTSASVLRDSVGLIVQPTLMTADQLRVRMMEPALTK